MQSLPAAELLLKQFLKAGDDVLVKASPQEALPSLLGDPRFGRSLASLRLLVGHHLPLLVRQLEGWRAANHNALAAMPNKTDRDRNTVFSKRAAMEVVYLEAALVVLEAYEEEWLEKPEFVSYYEGLQKGCMGLLLMSDELLAPELLPLSRLMAGAAGRVLGAVSRRVALAHVVEPFLRSLAERVNAKKDPITGGKPNYDLLRSQIVRLAGGMRHVVLSFSSPEAVREAVSFLRRAHPLQHTAPVKKSQIHHALCDMLSCCLLPLVRSNAQQRAAEELGGQAMEDWYRAVMSMRADITSWMKQHAKHVNVGPVVGGRRAAGGRGPGDWTRDGYPLATTLLCLSSDQDFSDHSDGIADFMHKGLKVKENRSACVRCLVLLACSYLVRYGAHIIRSELYKWLDRVLKPVKELAKKGGMSMQEILDVIAPLSELSPEYAVQNLIVEFLTSDCTDCIMAGMRALQVGGRTPGMSRREDARNGDIVSDLTRMQALILTAPAAAAAPGSGVSTGAQHRRTQSAAAPGQGGGGSGYPSYGSSGGGGGGLHGSSSSSGLQALLRRTVTPSAGGISSLFPGGSSIGFATSSGSSSLLGMSMATAASASSLSSLGPSFSSASTAAFVAAAAAPPPGAFAAVTELLRRGVQPLELLGVGHLLMRVNAALGKLLTAWHPLYGSYMSYGAPDPNWRDRAPGLPLLLTLVRLLPFLKPETWTAARPLDVLPSYTCHAEGSMRAAALEALGGLLRGSPHLRNSLVCGLASWALTLPDDAVQAQREAQSLVRSMLAGWQSLLGERAGGEAAELTHGTAETLSLDVHRLEGGALVGLTSHDEGVRREALQILHNIRSLHQAILAAEPYDVPHSPQAGGQHGGTAGRSSASGGHGAGVSSVGRNVSNGGLASMPSSAASGAVGSGASGRDRTSAGHGPSGSRDSLDLEGPAGAGGLSDAVEPDLTYVVELLEEGGQGLLRAAYWDFGDWAELWREHRPVPPDVSFEDVLTARPGDDASRVRLVRCLLGLMGLVVRLCPLSAGVAGCELVWRCGRMMGRREPDGRLIVHPDFMESSKRDAWRYCSAAVCPIPQSLRDRVQDRIGKRQQYASVRDIVRLHLALATGGGVQTSSSAPPLPAVMQLSSMLSLGHLAPELYGLLLEELAPFSEEFMGARGAASSKSKTRAREETRRCVSHVLRILADRAPHEVLASQPLLRSRLLEWIRDTYSLVRPSPLSSEAFWELVQVAYCLSCVVRAVAVPLRQLLGQPLAGGVQGAGAAGAGGGGATALSRDSAGRVGVAGVEGSASLRKLLWELFAIWNEEGYILLRNLKSIVASVAPSDVAAALLQSEHSNYRRAVDMGISALLAKHKEPAEGLREDLTRASHYLNHSSRLAMAALMEGPVFDADTRRPAGHVLTWVDKMLAVPVEGAQVVPGPARRDVGFRALRSLLTHNPDLFEPCLNKAYDSNASIANGYFQVLVEVYSSSPVRVAPPVLLGLLLVKMVDAEQRVREDALAMLAVLSAREWGTQGAGAQGQAQADGAEQPRGAAGNGTGAASSVRSALASGDADAGPGGGGGSSAGAFPSCALDEAESLTVLGSLPDLYTSFQYQLACKLAREHPELSEAVCEEVVSRQLECEEGRVAQPVLTSLAPWVENLVISFPWRGNWSERLLKSLYYVTLRHGSALPAEMERLWTQLARRTRNINPCLDFLLQLGCDVALQTDLAAMHEYLSVAQRIVLYLARVSPAETLGYLAIELAKQQQEEEPPTADALPLANGGLRGGRPSAGAQAQPQPLPVLLFGGPLDCVVTGDERALSLHASYDSAASGSQGGSQAASHSELGHSSRHRPRSLEGAPTRSEASGSSRSEPNGGVGGGGGGGGSSLPPDASTAGARGGIGGARPADDSGPHAGGGAGGGDSRQSPSQPYHQLQAARALASSSSAGRPLLTRPELVLCCLSEVVYEHCPDPQHLPLLLHAAVLGADAEEALLAGQCSSLLAHLLTIRGRRLWRAEQYRLAGPAAVLAAGRPDGCLTPSAASLAALVSCLAEALAPLEPDLPAEWAQRAADWAQQCRGRSACCRSWQVLRALRPPLGPELVAGLVLSMEAALAAAGPPEAPGGAGSAGAEVAVEVIATTRALVCALPTGRLVLYPQLWWAALALLHDPRVAVYRAALGLLDACISSGGGSGGAGGGSAAGGGGAGGGSRGLGSAACSSGLRLSSAKVAAVLLAAAPGLSAGQLLAASHSAAGAEEEADPWVLGHQLLNVREGGAASGHFSIAVQQLLLRGLTHPLTVIPTLHLLAALADALESQAASLSARAGAPTNVGPAAGSLQLLCSPQLAAEPELQEAVLTELMAALARPLLPRYATVLLHHIHHLIASAGAGAGTAGSVGSAGAGAVAMAGVAPSAPRQVRAALLMLRSLLRVEGLALGPAGAALLANGRLAAAVVGLTSGPLGPLAMDTLAAALDVSQAAAALKTVVDTLGSSVRRRRHMKLLPFLGGSGAA
ncbi:hypothetical protein GPECTOR_14g131 [Gonium pectorale]|uniref:Uncharacterized protein n=1 Tax=Gonium pectorale TaxID=33097 RepID=A0A150GM84_GONPE|nr:hypothetical protein GPECTOR_14g131 [Gonium pectorale]|eukprot:KXZ50882.1 hypothetical protein GPECTOR_14g131 [Gonium pectorale]